MPVAFSPNSNSSSFPTPKRALSLLLTSFCPSVQYLTPSPFHLHSPSHSSVAGAPALPYNQADPAAHPLYSLYFFNPWTWQIRYFPGRPHLKLPGDFTESLLTLHMHQLPAERVKQEEKGDTEQAGSSRCFPDPTPHSFLWLWLLCQPSQALLLRSAGKPRWSFSLLWARSSCRLLEPGRDLPQSPQQTHFCFFSLPNRHLPYTFIQDRSWNLLFSPQNCAKKSKYC